MPVKASIDCSWQQTLLLFPLGEIIGQVKQLPDFKAGVGNGIWSVTIGVASQVTMEGSLVNKGM